MRNARTGISVAAGAMSLLCALFLVSGEGLAGPTGAQVVQGQASVAQNGPKTTITAGNNAILNYQGFSIRPGETVQFIQPSAVSRVLNRVIGPDPSVFAGTLQANGRVYFVNPAGIYFTQGSVVNVGALYAAAGNLSNQDFLGGVNHFTDLRGPVVNEGAITAQAVHLIGERVANYGSIVAPGGLVTLLAGNDVYLAEEGREVFVKIEGPQSNSDAPKVENAGSVQAPGGKVMLGAGDVYSLAIRNTGSVKAQDVKIEGQGGGEVEVSGTIDASGKAPGQKGGSVTVTGETVALTGARIDASGDAGGGTVLIGGDEHGANPGVRNASCVWVGPQSSILADALGIGDGGKVVVWSEQATRYLGAIRVRGGPGGGNGGFVEVSGGTLDFRGSVDGSAPAGTDGTLLLDPFDLWVTDGSYVPGSLDDSYLETTPNISFTATGAPSTLSLEALVFYAHPMDILLQAQHTLTVGWPDGTTPAVLDVSAIVTAGHTFTLQAGDAGTVGGGNVTFVSGSSITTGGGVTIIAGNALQGTGAATLGAITTGGGAITVTAQQGLVVRGALNAGTGTVGLFANSIHAGDLGSAITGNAGIQIAPVTSTKTIGFDDVSKDINLDTTTNWANLLSTTGVTLGSDSYEGAITLPAGGFVNNKQLVLDVSGGGTVSIPGNVTGTGSLAIFGVGPSTTIGGNITQTSIAIGDDIVVSGAGTHTLTATTGGVTLDTSGLADGISADALLADLVLQVNTAGQSIALTGSFTNSAGQLLNNLTLQGNGVPAGLISFNASGDGASAGIAGNLHITSALGINLATNGDLFQAHGALSFDDSVTLTAMTSLHSGEGAGNNITFFSTVDGTQLLTLDAGAAGNIVFGDAVGGGEALDLVTIVNAHNVDFDWAVLAAGLTQITGTGTTTFSNILFDLSGPVDVTNHNITVNGQLDSLGNPLSLTANAAGGTLQAGAASTINSGAGALTLTADSIILGGAADSIQGADTITLQPFTEARPLVIGAAGGAGDFALSAAEIATLMDGFSHIYIGQTGTGAGGATISAITFNDPVTIQSAAGGAIVVNGQITGAGNASVELIGAGATTTLNADIVTNGSPIVINDGVIVGTPALVTLDTTGAGAVADGANITITGKIQDDVAGTSSLFLRANAFTYTVGSTVNLQKNVGDVTPLAALEMDAATGSFSNPPGVTLAAGDIILLVDSFAPAPAGLTATNVTLYTLHPGGTIGVEDASKSINYTDAFLDTIVATNLTIGSPGSTGGITIATDAAVTQNKNLKFVNGGTERVNAGAATALSTSGGGTITFTNAGVLTLAGNILSDGAITQNGAGAVTLTAPRTIATTGDAVSFLRAVTLNGGAGGLVSIATTPLGNNITFSSTVDATTAAPNAERLTLNAGAAGDVLFTGAVGTTRLGAVTVTNARHVTESAGLAAASFVQAAGAAGGTTLLTGAVNTSAATGVALTTSGAITVNNTITTTGAGVVTFTNGGSLTINGNIVSDGAVTQTGAGLVTVKTPRTITTTGDAVSFLSAVTVDDIVVGLVTIDTTASAHPAGNNITFSGAVDAATAAPNAEQLTLNAGSAGDVLLGAAAGGTTPLGHLFVSGHNITLHDVTTTGDQSYSATGKISLHSTYTTTDGGSFLLNTNRATPPQDATIYKDGGDLTITCNDFTMSTNDKLTVVGKLDLTAAGIASLGDITTLADMNVTAGTITLLPRAAGSVRTSTGLLRNDSGVDYVAGGMIVFSAAPGGAGVRAGQFAAATPGSGVPGQVVDVYSGVVSGATLHFGPTVLDLVAGASAPASPPNNAAPGLAGASSLVDPWPMFGSPFVWPSLFPWLPGLGGASPYWRWERDHLLGNGLAAYDDLGAALVPPAATSRPVESP